MVPASRRLWANDVVEGNRHINTYNAKNYRSSINKSVWITKTDYIPQNAPQSSRHSFCISLTNWWMSRKEKCLEKVRTAAYKEQGEISVPSSRPPLRHPPPPRLGNAIGWEKVEETGRKDLRICGVGGGRPRVSLEYAGEGRGRSDRKTAQHSTFLIANRDGSSRGLNGRLFHECAWGRHVHGCRGTPETSLIPNTEQLQRRRTEKTLSTYRHRTLKHDWWKQHSRPN